MFLCSLFYSIKEKGILSNYMGILDNYPLKALFYFFLGLFKSRQYKNLIIRYVI